MSSSENPAATDRYDRKRIAVLDTEMSYVDSGSGDPIVFLHGNPTWSYLWRNVMPEVEGLGRLLAPDLVGMGESGKAPAGRYRIEDHSRYLAAWFDALDLRGVTLVLHDWGGPLGFTWARLNPDRVRRVAYMETIVLPVNWEDWDPTGVRIFQGMRSEKGEELILERNTFIERILPGSVLRTMTDTEMDAYRSKFPTPGEDRRPMLTFPRELPIEGQPADVIEQIEANGRFMQQSAMPKLFINAEPGSILIGRQREFCRSWPNQREVTVAGRHFIQEDSPREIGQAVARFVRETGA